MGRPPCCDKSNVKRGLWTAEEDAKILAHVSKHGTGNWTLVPQKAGLNRCGKSCRLRWTNYLRPDLNHSDFTPLEEDLIINLHQAIGSRWSLIAKQLPGRTDNDVKNYWNTKLRKKLYKMGIDPLTHKPFSRVLSDFGHVSGFSNPLTDPNTNLINFVPQQQQQPHIFITNEAIPNSSSSSSSSSCCSSIPLISHESHSSFNNWTEFLVRDDPRETTTTQIEKEDYESQGRFSSIIDLKCGGDHNSNNNNNVDYYYETGANSFVDAILDRDSELRSTFPDFLDESLEYY